MGQLLKDKGMSESVVDHERHRLQLEENISKLQKSLQYWQTWEAEYEGLKEEISGLGDRHSLDQLKSAGDEFGGDLLNQKEINLLLEDARGHARSSQQVLGLLNRRIEYVQNNINSAKSLLHEAETKAAASIAIGQEVCNDEGLPPAEIREDLDDEGNIISSSITSPSDTAPLVIETLRKSGVEGLPESRIQRQGVANITDEDAISNKPTDVEGPGLDLASAGVIDNVESIVPKADTNASVRRKKSVSFAEGTKEGDATTSKSRNIASREQKAKMTYLRRLLRPGMPAEEIIDKMSEELKKSSQNIQNLDQKKTKETSKKSGTNRPIAQGSNRAPSKPLVTAANTELKSNGKNSGIEAFSAIIPASDTAEEAALRRQMIQYQTADVGPVVAQIDLDEDDSDIWTGEDDSDAWTDSDEVNDSSAEEDEDQYGRTKRRVVSDEYRQEMLALQEKLNAKSMKNVGPGGDISTLPKAQPKEVNRLIDNDATTPLARKTSPTKEVRFAADVQIQDHQHPSTSGSNTQLSAPQDPPRTKKPSISRFKAERTNSSPSTTTTPKPTNGSFASSILERPYNPTLNSSTTLPNPPTAITSDTIIERPYKATSPSSPAPPNTEDPALVHQQLTTEYHRLRNRMIYRQGGFLTDDDDGDDEKMGEEVEVGEGKEVGGEVSGKENVSKNEKKTQQAHQQPNPDESTEQGDKKISRFRTARLKGYQ